MTDKQLANNNQLVKILVILVDLTVLSATFPAMVENTFHAARNIMFPCWYLSYFVSIILVRISAHDRLVKAYQVVGRALATAMIMAVLMVTLLNVFCNYKFDLLSFIYAILITSVTMIMSRSVSRLVIKQQRVRGKDHSNVIMVGATNSLRTLYDRMGTDISVGYTYVGYFNDERVQEMDEVLQYRGTCSSVYDYLKDNRTDMVFFSPGVMSDDETTKFIDYCENNLIHFYTVPTLPDYHHHRLSVEYVYEIPIMSIRHEPLSNTFNRIMKRAFDIVFSGLFLVTCFWWIYIIVAIITKITMPGPVLFMQKRSGRYGTRFTCLKFRSMRVNDQADTVQASRYDPRKTKWGDFMRRTNIDELPQFINVIKGDMSIVGPRPHMLKHTEEYRMLVDKYMVRHYAKPGITGWAQVTGSRGETPELWMMEERIQKDIWYLENWSMLLDVVIIIKTVINVFGKEKGNAY